MDIKQAIEFSNHGERLPVCEQFYSLQGEGYHFGRAAFFVRLSGCNVCCSWCDTKMSWGVNENDFVTIDELVNVIKKSGTDCAVITGGEPTIYSLKKIVQKLINVGIEVNLETSGTGNIPEHLNWVTLSPKEKLKPLDENFKKADELKMVISSEESFDIAEMYSQKVEKKCKLYLQPEWNNKESLNLIIEYIKFNTKWRLSLQTHKYINIE